jgi:hypothetical protein
MKTLKNLAGIFILLINFTANSQVSCTGSVFAEIVPVTAASEINPLNFGQFTPIGGGGNVVITPQGNRISNGSVALTESLVHQGIFSVYGTQNNTVQVILPTSPVYIYHQNGINYMYLDTWTIEMPKAGSSMSNKDYLVNIGSTLHIGPIETNPIGAYSCTYQIIFLYN